MLDYQPGDIQCETEPREDLDPRPHAGDTCGGSSSQPHPRDPDQDDPEAQPEAKRQRPFDLNDPYYSIDLNNVATDGGEAGGSNQGDNRQQVDLNFPGDRARVDWFAYLRGVRKDNFAIPGTVKHGANTLYNTGQALGGSLFFTLLEYSQTSAGEEITSSLKRPQQWGWICHEKLTSFSMGIHYNMMSYPMARKPNY
jgi:hypothetical protein